MLLCSKIILAIVLGQCRTERFVFDLTIAKFKSHKSASSCMQIRCLGTGKELRVSRCQFLWASLSEQSSVVEYAGRGNQKKPWQMCKINGLHNKKMVAMSRIERESKKCNRKAAVTVRQILTLTLLQENSTPSWDCFHEIILYSSLTRLWFLQALFHCKLTLFTNSRLAQLYYFATCRSFN